MARAPDSKLAARVLPAPLYNAVTHLFGQGIENCMLVGGTALAGYYAGHRRSDDLDLFVRDSAAHTACVLAVESWATLGAVVTARQRTPQFYDATCKLSGHPFTVQVVSDQRLFQVGTPARADDGVAVANLETLLRQKAATLVSRCSEKDLYDLLWLFDAFPSLKVQDLVALGAEIDAGMNAETSAISLAGANLREAACDFSPTRGADAVFREICALRRSLMDEFERLARRQPMGPLGEIVRRLKP